jgi:hypothetical protein
VQADVGDSYRATMKVIDAELNHLLDGVSLGDAEQWAFIAIIREEDSPRYEEVVKKSSRGKVLEFRLKVPHTAFLSAAPSRRIRLIWDALSRSVALMTNLGVRPEIQRSLHEILAKAGQQLATEDRRAE